MSVLTIADINTAISQEPRIEDERLAVTLGFERPRAIRELIEHHEAALTRFGEVCRTVRQTSERGGRPGRTYWLNLRQALYLATKSEAENAVDLTVEMVEVFASVKEGHEVSATDRAPSLPTLDRSGLAVMRIGGKTVTVDTRVFKVGPTDRVVRVHHDGRIDIGKVMVDMRPDFQGIRGAYETPRKRRHNGRPSAGYESTAVQVLGLVVDEVVRDRPKLPRSAGRKRVGRFEPMALPRDVREQIEARVAH